LICRGRTPQFSEEQTFMPDQSDQFDLTAMMRQLQALQEKFSQLQNEAASKTVEASAGGGMVKVVADGSQRIRSIEIDPALLAGNDRALIQDRVVAAVNDALARAQELVASAMGSMAPFGAMKFPGPLGGGT
jgi:DNA-binding YbaB/EbfC family protein